MTAQIKICGISTPQAMEIALENGADFIGLVFYPPSPRNILIAHARLLARQARGKAKIVALTVDASNKLIGEIAADVQPDYIQTHGSETPGRLAEIKQQTGLPIIKAIKVRDAHDVGLADDFKDIADIILFDAKAPDNSRDALPGGNGELFDWSLLATANPPENFMLSGGLTPDNIANAIQNTNAAYFDVSSGVESSPGKKDLNAIKNFIVAARNAG